MTLSALLSVYAMESPTYLYHCLKSFIDQQRQPDQIVLVMDGPLPKELEKVIDSFLSLLPIELVKLEVNSGLAVALNKGLAACTGDYVARMDTDDVMLPERFSVQLSYMQANPNVDLAGCFATEIDEENHKGKERIMPVEHAQIVSSLWSNPFIHPTVIFKRDKMVKIGGYNTNLRRRQDYELWFRCAKSGFTLANIPRSLLLYRFVAESHQKQTLSLAWGQALIGFSGASSINMPMWKRVACFVPFFRSLLPLKLQHWLYGALKKFDPRQQKVGD